METRAQDLVAAPADPSLPLREARKERTHRALLDAALVLTEQVGFASVSLRQVTKAAGIVPTAFYRHYDSMDALGETLVVEPFGSLRKVIRAVRTGSDDPAAVITRSAEVLVSHGHTNRTHFRFIATERSGGVDALRRSIRHELEVVVVERILDSPDEEVDVVARAERQMTMVLVGAASWRSR